MWASTWTVGMTMAEGAARGPGAAPASTASAAALDEADDRALVEAFVGGRRDAFDVIVLRHQRQVYRVCYRFAGNQEDAADLVQDVFIRAFRSLGRFKHESSLRTWLYRIAVNTCLSRVAVPQPVRAPIDEVEMSDQRADGPLETVLASERAAAVRAAIGQLPPKQRATVVLRIYEGLSHQEISHVLGSTVGAAKANLCHALGNLRRILQP